MPEWIIAALAIVQGVSMLVLAVLTGWYAYWIKRQVKQHRDFFEQKAAQSAELVQRQANEFNDRGREQIGRAIQTIATELELNAIEGEWKFQQSPPLLNTAYAANLWAVHLIGMAPVTFRALGDAYLSVHRYNFLYGAAADAERRDPGKTNAAQSAWGAAQPAIRNALAQLRKDPATSGLLPSSGSGDSE